MAASTVRLIVEDRNGEVGVWLQREGDLVSNPPAFAPFACLLTDDDRKALRWYLEDYLLHPYAVWQEDGTRIAGQLDAWGEALFNAVFGEGRTGRDAYIKAREAEAWPELVLVSQSAGFLALPWELLKDPQRSTPLALDLAGITRTISTEAKAATIAQGQTLRVLMVIARPLGEHDVGYQMIARPLLSRLAAVRGTVSLDVLRPPTLEALETRLNQAASAGEPFHILHFDGHGAFGVAVPQGEGGGFRPDRFDAPQVQGHLVFEKADGSEHLVPATDFALTLSRAQVPVMVFNACQSATLQDGVEAQAGVATRMIDTGAAAVVAMGYTVYAVAAAEFMTAFYDALFRGEPMAEAVAAGRRRMARNRGRPSPKGDLPLQDWLVPVVYARRAVAFPNLKPAAAKPAELSLDTELDRLRDQPSDLTAGRDPLAPDGGVFFGRDAAIYRLERSLRLKRVVVVHGLGGTGKTELAKAFARWLRDSGGLDRPDFVHFHSFEPGLASFGLDGVVTQIGLRLFGTDFVGRTDGSDQRRDLVLNVLRQRRMLLVWDNFESVYSIPDDVTPPLEEAQRTAMRGFLTALAAPGGHSGVIITSRAREVWLTEDGQLDVDRIELGGLDREAANEYVDHLLAHSATARERRKEKAFGELLAFLGGHPLSLRLILPQLTHRPPDALLDELRGDALTAVGAHALRRRPGEGDPAAALTAEWMLDPASVPRLGSLDACVEYSFRHLPADIRRLLPALSLFEGVTDANVLATLSTIDGVPMRFQGVSREDWTAALDQAAGLGLLTPLWGGQHRIHPALPLYLAGLWRDDAGQDYAAERDAAEDAFLTAAADFGRWLDQQIKGGSAETALAVIDLQRRTLGRVIDRALAAERWSEAQEILQPLNEFWMARGLSEEAGAWTARVGTLLEGPAGKAPDFDSPAGALWLFVSSVDANRAQDDGDLNRAFATHDQVRGALEASKAESTRPRLSAVYHQLGFVSQLRGDLEGAERWHKKSLEIKEAIGDRRGVASSYHHLGMVAHGRYALDTAQHWYQKAAEIAEALKDRPYLAAIYHQLGMVAEHRGDSDGAVRWHQDSLDIREALDDRPGMAKSYHQLGVSDYLRGDLNRAQHWYQKSLEIKESLGNQPGMAKSYHQLGLVAQDRGDLEGGERWYRKALEIEQALGDRPSMAMTYGQLGLLAESRCSKTAALDWVARCVALFDSFPHPSTGPGPKHLVRLTSELGMSTLEAAWQRVTDHRLPDAVRAYVESHATDTDPDAVS